MFQTKEAAKQLKPYVVKVLGLSKRFCNMVIDASCRLYKVLCIY